VRFGENYFMKKIFFCSLFFFVVTGAFTQVQWNSDPKLPNHITWSNYSTSYPGDVSDSVPFLIACIPYNGVYTNFGEVNAPLDLTFEGSLYQFRSSLFDRSLKLNTYDSADVYFLAQGVYECNASKFQFRVTLNGKEVITPWSNIKQFADIAIGPFKKGAGFLGGYSTGWNNLITVELRKEGSDTSLSSAVVYWKETKPSVASIYTSRNLDEFFGLNRSWDKNVKSSIPVKNPVFTSIENSIIYYIGEDIFKKEALEYQLVKDGKVIKEWKPNDYDNNFIWLKDLVPGKYRLNLRFSKQRQNISSYDFQIKPAWHQTTSFKIIAGGLIAAFFAFLFLLYRLRLQKQKLRVASHKKERAEMELRSIYSRLNPHFIFNSLSSIQGLINKNETKSANHYLTTFSSLLRDSLVNSDKDRVPLSAELKTLETYLRLEQLRFHFQYSVEVDEGIDTQSIEIPSLLLQPLVENAIKHGVSAKQDKGYIGVRFRRMKDDLQVSITDNGPGFDNSLPTNGFGLKLTKERIRLLNEGDKVCPVLMSIRPAEGKGTTVDLQFKNWL
jgi:two-component sensor histidine kinase